MTTHDPSEAAERRRAGEGHGRKKRKGSVGSWKTKGKDVTGKHRVIEKLL